MNHKYIAYSTPWTEGVAVIREDDTKYPVGYDPNNGVAYTDKMAELGPYMTVHLITTNIAKAAELDTAGYTRFGKDNAEVEFYNQLVSAFWGARQSDLLIIFIGV